MPFCTSCGATMSGVFCTNCGTPAKGAAAASAPPPPPNTPPAAVPQYAAAPPPGSVPMPAAAPHKSSPLVWILVAIGCVFLLGIVAFIGISALVVHKARQAGFSAELMRRNPAAAVARMAAIANHDVEIVSEDDNAGTITLRDRHTGKVVTMSFDQVKSGFSIRADDGNGQSGVVQFGGEAKLPSWVPNYPGSNPQSTISAQGTGNDGSGRGGNFTFTTSDSPTQVLSFYEDKAKDLGLKVDVRATASDAGGTMVARDVPERRSLTVIVGGGGGQTTVNVTYGEKR